MRPWAPTGTWGRSPTRPSFGAWSTRSLGSSRKPSGLSRSTRPLWRRSAGRWPGRSGPSGRSTRATATCAAWRSGALRRAPRSSRRSAAGWRSRRARGAPADGNFPRAGAARRSGLHAGFGFPLRSARGVVGVMEFFSGELREHDERLLATLDALGSKVGQVVERRRAEEEVRKSESRLRAMLETALDAVVTMDDGGRVIGWNHAAEATFGYRADEVLGRDMAELIVPPALRSSHRRGLARYR